VPDGVSEREVLAVVDAGWMFTRPTSRREFLERALLAGGVLGLPQILAACGGDGEGTPQDGAPGGETGQVGGTFNLLTWEGYDILDATKSWRKEMGIEMNSIYMASTQDPATKVLAPGATPIDCTTCVSQFADWWTEIGILTEIRPDEIPFMEDLYEVFQEGSVWRTETGNYRLVPFSWGANTCQYVTTETEAPSSWRNLLEPQFEGKVAMTDDPLPNVMTSCLILGFDPAALTAEQLGQVKEFLLEMKAQAKSIAPSYGDTTNLLTSGEAIATFPGWSAIQVFAGDDADVQSVSPSEGVYLWVDSWTIPSTAEHRANALAWMAETNTAEIQAAQAEALAAGVTRPDAVDLIEDDIVKDLYPYDDLEGYFAETTVLQQVGGTAEGDATTFDDWLTMWEEVKAG
jgi:spermidine/putrescine transport system substrate-binding protein